MYYKIVSDGQIVDACSSLNYVRYQAKNGLWITTGEEAAEGIISSDGSSLYILDGTSAAERCPAEGYSVASAAEISGEEYEALRQELVGNGMVSDSGENQGAGETETGEGEAQTVAKSQALILIEQLQGQVAELEAQNEMLLTCLLEMSAVVYA